MYLDLWLYFKLALSIYFFKKSVKIYQMEVELMHIRKLMCLKVHLYGIVFYHYNSDTLSF